MEIYNVLLILSVVSLSSAFDYCTLCENHIACGNNGSLSSLCPNDTMLITLTPMNKLAVLNAHNNVRNLLAAGNVTGYSSASKMMLVKWDDELAYLAELNVKQCQMKHDSCRATTLYPVAGQNLYTSYTFPTYKSVDTVFADAVRLWFNEYSLTNQTVINNCCGGTGFKSFGHFLQVAQDRVKAIGCALIRYKTGRWFTSLVACNYSFANILYESVYTSGPAASACQNGTSPIFTKLCNW